MTTETIVTAIASLGVGGMGAALIGAVSSRKKFSAEAAQAITAAGAGVATSVEGFVERVSKENERLYKENAALHTEVKQLRRENEVLSRKVDDLTLKVESLMEHLSRVGVDARVTRDTIERVEREQQKRDGHAAD